MAIVSSWNLVDMVAILVGLLIVGLATYFKWSFKYWEKRGIPYAQPKFPFGTINNPLGTVVSFGDQCKKFYDVFKAKGHAHVGLFLSASPLYLPISPEYIKNMLTRDFEYFEDHGVYYNEKDDPISAHLFTLEGAKWWNLRTKLTPAFTSSKIKAMFQILLQCGNQLKDVLDEVSEEKDPVDIKDILTRFSTDVIGSCAFGIDCNSCKNPSEQFRLCGKRVFFPTKWESLKVFIAFNNPKIARFFRFCLIPKDAASFFMRTIKETVEYREKNNFTRKDFMQILINLKNNHDSDEKGLTMEELSAQAFLFYLAGYETSSTAITFCLFELAVNPDIQQKVREEIDSVLEKHGGNITYEAIQEMKYMDQVFDETFRKYPPVTVITRICVKEYKIPGTDIVIEKGMPVGIPVLGLHRDPEYFPDPERFDPERFSDSNKGNIKPFTYLPFGEGPRICIGLRFGVTQSKIGLAVLLKHFRFSLNEKTQTPLKINPFTFVMSALGEIWLNVEKV